MRKYILPLVAMGLAAAALALTCARRGATAPPPAAAPVTLIPVAHLKLSKDMAVEMEFENTSTQPIKYFQWMGAPYVTWALIKDGRALPGNTIQPPGLAPSAVHELQPRQRLTQTFKLREWYRDRDLKPGRYLLHASYGEGSSYGLTPMQIEQSMYVIIEE